MVPVKQLYKHGLVAMGKDRGWGDSRKKLVVANWKQNGNAQHVDGWCSDMLRGGTLRNVEAVVCPPFIYLPLCRERLGDSWIGWGGQDVSQFSDGAHTGEIGIDMLEELRCSYALVGHSERRAECAEGEQQIAAKMSRFVGRVVRPVLCVGEKERRTPQEACDAVCGRLAQQKPVLKQMLRLVIAYEPIWAIGTGITPSVDEITFMFACFRSHVKDFGMELANVRFVYGGSVNAENCRDILTIPGVDGVLVGGFSYVAESFLKICIQADI